MLEGNQVPRSASRLSIVSRSFYHLFYYSFDLMIREFTNCECRRIYSLSNESSQ